MNRTALTVIIAASVVLSLDAHACLPYRINGVVTYLAFDGKQCPDRSCCSGSAVSPSIGEFLDAAAMAARLETLIKEHQYARLPNSPFDSMIARTARRHDLDPLLVKSVIRVESNFNPFAISRKGAGGLMQLMPETAQRYGVWNRFDPSQNIQAGVKLLRSLLTKMKSLDLALAAYNAGETAVRRHGGIPPYPETRRYVAAVKGYYQRAVNEREPRS